MKSIITALFVLLSAMPAFAGDCIDISGKYLGKNDDGTQSVATFVQTGCELLEVAGDGSTHTYLLDGVFRDVGATGGMAMLSAHAGPDQIEMSVVMAVPTIETPPRVEAMSTWMSYSLDPTTKDLVLTVKNYSSDGKLTSTTTYTAQRQ